MFKKILKIFTTFLLVIFVLFLILSYRKKPESIKYGMSFNVPYAVELGLDWQETFLAMIDDLGVKRLRLAAHWPLLESELDQYDFSYLDFQLEEARKRDVEVILAIGRRLPRWPECHMPAWTQNITDTEWQEQLLKTLEVLVNRYKDYENIIYWQIENEPFLEVFAYEHCGDFDKEFLDREIALVRELDDSRPILLTDSGNIGPWTGAYPRGDVFGTSVYLYFWNPYVGKFRSFLPARFYGLKANLMNWLYGEKEVLLIELSLEPWLIQPLVKTSLQTQFDMMNLRRMNNILEYAKRTRFEYQYLWGGEWWYWLKAQHNNSEMWDFGKEIFKNSK
jgi:hypothetical protein